MLRRPIALCVLVLPALLRSADMRVISTAADLRRALSDEGAVGRDFLIEATCLEASRYDLYFEDATGAMRADSFKATFDVPPEKLTAGDRLRIEGRMTPSHDCLTGDPLCHRVVRLGGHADVSPIPASGEDIANGSCDYRLVQIDGVICGIYHDEIDPNYAYLSVDCNGHRVLVGLRLEKLRGLPTRRLVGASIGFVGTCNPQPGICRKLPGRLICPLQDGEIRIGEARDVFSAPELKLGAKHEPDDAFSLRMRGLKGRILTTWNGNRALVRSLAEPNAEPVHVTFAAAPFPDCGKDVEIAGYPGTDFYNHTLTHALWRPLPAPAKLATEQPKETTVGKIMTDRRGRRRFDPRAINRLLTVRGVVRAVSDLGEGSGLILEDGPFTLRVNVRECLTPTAGLNGCSVRVTGYLIPEIDSWSSNNEFPAIRSVFLAIRDASDVTVVRRPSWWTPLRLSVVVIVLLLVVAGIVVWNVMLRRVAERRGRELAAESVSHAEANMRTYERTRLAVELHDALSQNLTGVAMRIQAAEQYAEGASSELTGHLGIAERTLKACRIELKNCLWDLRSQALEEQSLDNAIRLTLKPYLADVALQLRFNVPRSRLTDNSAHTLLRIIRELVVNGIQHGKATLVRIAGSIEDNVLKFSVADNGCGFVPEDCPGVEQGHFGLEGIRERVRMMSGEMTLVSAPGQGTKTTISIRMPKACEDEKHEKQHSD